MALTIPQFQDFLSSIGAGEANESGTRYTEDGRRLSQGQLDEMMGNDLASYQSQAISEQGYQPLMGDDFSGINEQHGTNFSGHEDYLNYIYGPGGTIETGPDGKQYYKAPGPQINPHLRYTDPDKKMSNLVKMGLFGLAGAGLGGFLPGVEGVFGATAGGTGAGAGAAAGGAGSSTGAGTGWLTGGLAPGAGIGGVGTAGLGLTAPATTSAIGALGGGLGLTAGTGAAASMGAGAATPSFLSSIGDFASSLFKPAAQGGSGLNWGDVAKTGLNYVLNNNSAKNLEEAAMNAASMSNPLNDPKRQPYQEQLAQLLANPTSFYETNPVVKAQMDLAKRQFEANSAKMGVGGTQFNAYLKNVQNNAATTFNDQAELLSGLGGFGFPGGNNGSTYMQGQQAANTQQNEAYRGIGDIASKIFNSQGAKNFMSGETGFSLG